MGKKSRRLVFAATSTICLLVLPLLYASLFASNFNPFDPWKHNLSNWRNSNGAREKEEESLKSQLRRLVKGKDEAKLNATGFSCHADLHTEVCIANTLVKINNSALAVYITPSRKTQSNAKLMVRPYARKEDETAMEIVTPVQILYGNQINPPACRMVHTVPAVIFSSGGFTGNLFHEFNEIIIPLFITCRHFRSRLRFVITDFKPWWVRKYNQILTHLSAYKIINPLEDGRVHCFPGAVIGLQYHDNLAFNKTNIPERYSMSDFKTFLREVYSLKTKNVQEMARQKQKPVLLLISRHESRQFLNEDEMMRMMEKLGFRIIITKPNMMSNLEKFATMVNSCSVIVGAHGAGLTNAVFLPAGAVIVQVVPRGLDWASHAYFSGPVKEMGLRYLEYKIEPEESSLIDTYDRDDPVFTNPSSIFLKGYRVARATYVDGQSLKINLTRFSETLVQALKLLKRKEW